jgi:hypothetical protein
MALAIIVPLAACGMLGSKEKPAPSLDNGELITKPVGPGLVARCPVPAAYDDAPEDPGRARGPAARQHPAQGDERLRNRARQSADVPVDALECGTIKLASIEPTSI